MDRYIKNSKIKTMKIKKGNKTFRLKAEMLKDCSSLDEKVKEKIKKDIKSLIKECWGDFGEKFIEKHIISADFLLILRHKDKIVGTAAISRKSILNKNLYYLEFTAISPEIQSSRLMGKVNFALLRYIFFDNLIKNKKLTIEFMLISPNLRVLGSMAKITSFMYPNPFLFDKKKKKIPPPDEETWQMAKELIRQSDNPNRFLHKDGCVLEDSYKDTPWLIYKKDKIPWHKNETVNKFGETYIQYSKETGKEFVIRAKINLKNIFLYYLGNILK
ncbi:hypothetical protein J7J23_02695 [bacterium]|nr:hypothetical protein [bacterium]